MGLFDDVGGFLSGGGIIGGALDITGKGATADALAAQSAAAGQSNATQKYIYDQNRADNQPWHDAGVAALGKMQDPSFQKSFTMDDFHADPGYQFALDQGQKALERSASAKGMQFSGGQMKALSDYGQGMANQQYQNVYNRFNQDQSTRFGRLGTLAGYGQNASAANQQSGMNYGNNVSQTQMGLGNAQAADYMGQANRNSQMLSQGASMAAMFCDRRLKTDIEPVSKADLAELKSCIRAFKFRYQSENHGIGDFVGPMAQDLEKCKLGKGLVTEDALGNKKIDVHRTLMLILASWQEA